MSITQYGARIRRWAIALVDLRLGSGQMSEMGQSRHSDHTSVTTQRPARRIPQWLTIDLLVIVVSLAIIGIYIAID